MIKSEPKIIIVPEVLHTARTWWERLFTRPWRPLVKTKIERNRKCPVDGQVLIATSRFGADVLYMNAATAREYREMMKRR